MPTLRSRGVPGLIINPGLTVFNPRTGQRNVTSVTMTFEPSLGIMARRVDKLGMDIRSFREPLQRVLRDVVIPSIMMNFHKHGRTPEGTGNAWPPLSEETIARKGHARMLVDTGMLRKTMQRQNIWELDGEKLLLANLPQNVWYGLVHQQGYAGEGTTVSVVNIGTGARTQFSAEMFEEVSGEIPARPFVQLTNEEIDQVDEVFLNWLDERALRAGWPTTARSKILSGDY